MAARARYAIYYYPRSHPELLRMANTWLGRDVFTGESLKAPDLPGLSHSEIDTITRNPRHYGFHATLKAPFYLARGLEESSLITNLRSFTAAHVPFVCPPLKLAMLSNFICLRPVADCVELDELAMACVQRFESFRAPASSEMSVKRHATKLTPSQRLNLSAYGYPFVGSDFRFHMTLTGPLPETRGRELARILADYFQPELGKTLHIDNLSLYRQPTNHIPFEIVENFSLGDAG